MRLFNIPEGDCDCDGNVLDECGICGGDGIPAGDCDCDGNVRTSVAFVAEMAFSLATVTAMATSLTLSENVADLVRLTRMPTASATTLTLV